MEAYTTIGFIGAGNMGEAMIGALIHAGLFSPSTIYASDVSNERLSLMKKNYGIHVTTDNFKLFSQSHILVLAVKPQQMDPVLSQIAGHPGYAVSNRKLILTIAAGIRIQKLETILYAPLDESSRSRMPIIRVMPNTPALVLEGMSGMSANRYAAADDVNAVRRILTAMGTVLEFKEDDLDAVTALSGSGPAYVFYLAESMIAAGIRLGFTPEDAKTLTLATLKGSLKLMLERNEPPETLRRKVTSPGGTTEAAFKIIENQHVKQTFMDAISAAAQRSKELSQ